jgi:type II secretory pathway pseudopilin PulG
MRFIFWKKTLRERIHPFLFLSKGFLCVSAFTLIEVLVAMAIIISVLTVVSIGYRDYADRANLNQGVQILASSIRRVQVYGIAVRERTAGGGQFPSYGISLNMGSPDRYRVFADMDNDNRYDAGEEMETIVVPGPGYVWDICIETKAPSAGGCLLGGSSCRSTGGSISGLEVLFKRPVPDVFLYDSDGNPLNPCNDVEMVLRSPRGRQKQVVIWKSGQVAVENL